MIDVINIYSPLKYGRCWEGRKYISRNMYDIYPPLGAEKEKRAWGSAQPIEKAQNGQGNPRKSWPFPLLDSAGIWPGLER